MTRGPYFALLAALVAIACGKSNDEPSPAPAPSTAGVSGVVPLASSDTATVRAVPAEELLIELAKAARCADPEPAGPAWCVVANGWSEGVAADIPTGSRVLVGVGALLESGKVELETLAQNATLHGLALRNENGALLARVVDVEPDNDEEAQLLKSTAANLVAVIEERAALAPFAPVLRDFFAAQQATLALSKGERGWLIAGPPAVEMRQIGSYWVTLSRPHAAPRSLAIAIFATDLGAGQGK